MKNLDYHLFLAQELAEVEEELLSIFDNVESQIEIISKHVNNAGGKRLRPALVIMASKLFADNNPKAVRLAVAVELIHIATLLHDDVVDVALKRRGIDTANIIWGNKATVLAGDYLFASSFKKMVESNSLEALEVLANASRVIANGEVAQMVSNQELNLDVDRYYQVITGKTAELFKAAVLVSGIVNDANMQQKEALVRYGSNLGIAFQIVDDLLDYYAEYSSLGKYIGKDWEEAKITLPIINLFNDADAKDRLFLENMLKTDSINRAESFPKVVELMDKYGVFGSVYAKAREHIQEALEALDIFDNDIMAKGFMQSILQQSLERKH